MKTKTVLFRMTVVAFVTAFGFTSCEKEEDDDLLFQDAELTIEELATIEQDSKAVETLELKNDATTRNTFVNRNVNRYYSGGSNTVHTYRSGSLGVSIGTNEGVSFNAPLAPVGTPFNSSVYNRGFFLLHPQSKDFVISVNANEINRLISQGWSNRTFQRILFKKTSGGGTVPLYRFYNSQNSDHLFTRNYSEGANASGFVYEGIVGYVK